MRSTETRSISEGRRSTQRSPGRHRDSDWSRAFKAVPPHSSGPARRHPAAAPTVCRPGRQVFPFPAVLTSCKGRLRREKSSASQPLRERSGPATREVRWQKALHRLLLWVWAVPVEPLSARDCQPTSRFRPNAHREVRWQKRPRGWPARQGCSVAGLKLPADLSIRSPRLLSPLAQATGAPTNRQNAREVRLRRCQLPADLSIAAANRASKAGLERFRGKIRHIATDLH